MPKDAPEMTAGSGAETTPKGSKARLLTLADLDKRTRAAQRAFELRDRIVAERGGAERMSVLKLAMIESIAVVSAMIKDAEVRWLRGEPVELSEIGTLLNARRREAQMVGLEIEPKDVTPTLSDYLASRAAGEDAA